MKQIATLLLACSLSFAHAQTPPPTQPTQPPPPTQTPAPVQYYAPAPEPRHTPPAAVPKISLNVLGGYVFGDNVSTDQYYGHVNGGFQWQAGFEFGLKKMYGLELYYVRQDTHIDAENYAHPPQKTFNAGINYILLGGKRYSYIKSETLMAWYGVSLGAAFGNNEDGDGSYSKFAWGLRVGLKAKPNKESKIGFLFQAQLLSAVQAAGGGIYFGTGVGAGVSTYSTIYQFGLSGGISIALK
ncbi:hypothetical protein [Pinibacter soli]|uniref:Outer membrane protein beta-barrel domain-containing protein n=1 Tax=Pinibacter soli TaxID=3044211 RepID=A0ABT6RDC5_9BACT|nr:hypothetical protein [Pinibacter soli]MDI3320518.1 hypothetical protein [Pinibacter soli]